MRNLELFRGEVETKNGRQMSIVPCSVIDVWKQTANLREVGWHDDNSSRQQYSSFPEEVSRTCYELYLRDCNKIFDPFAGWGERGFYAKEYGKEYVGYDISALAIQHAMDHYDVENVLADSTTESIAEFDGLITCPPYWNLERYHDDGLDSCSTWDSFLVRYLMIFARAYEVATDGAIFCVMVGDWRKEGIYYDIAHQTRKIFEQFGATTIDDVVVSRKGITKIKIMLPQAKRLGYSVKVHESLLVFKK